MHSANILPPPSPRAAPLSLFAISDAVSCHPVAPVLALQPRSLPQLPRYRRLASRSFCALCCLFSLTVRRSFRALSRLVGLQLPQLPRRYRDSCVVAGAGNVQRPFVGVG